MKLTKRQIKCRLEEIMLKRGISNVELAEMTGLYASQISNIKYGVDVRISTAQAIAKALKLKIDFIWPY